jgi:hypothetical protein
MSAKREAINCRKRMSAASAAQNQEYTIVPRGSGHLRETAREPFEIRPSPYDAGRHRVVAAFHGRFGLITKSH